MRKTKAMLWARACAWVWAVALCAAACGAHVMAQVETPKGAPASVTGRVTDGKRGLAGVAVILMLDGGSPWSSTTTSAKTDAEGRYRASGLVPGRYQVRPVAPAHVLAEGLDVQRSRSLLLGAGETVENVDFRLTRGAVITGRVTGADGRPLVGEFVRVTIEDGLRPAHNYSRPDRTELMTDDRGVYRVYGLAAGRYLVSVGQDGPPRGPRNTQTTSGAQTYNQRTYYPSVTDRAQAKFVELTEGGEATDIDISVEKTTRQTYAAAGRIVFADTNQPAANVRVGYAQASRSGRMPMINFGNGGFVGGGGFGVGVVADARGEFKFEGLPTGRYTAFAVREGDADWYGEQTLFEINDADAEGIEVKLRRGSTLSGVLQFEGVSDRATLTRLISRARVFAVFEQTSGGPPAPGRSASVNVNADGSFTFRGLQPGRVRMSVGGDRDSGITLLRVDYNGADAARGIDVAEGAQLTGVRVFATYGSAVVRGQINVTGGTLPTGWSLRVVARRLGGEGQTAGRSVEADSRGLFLLENLVSGEYEFQAVAHLTGTRGGGGGPGGGGRFGVGGGGGAGGAARGPASGPPQIQFGPKQRVVVAPNSDQTITLVLAVN